MNEDGSERAKAVPYPVNNIQGISPGRRWILAITPLADNSTVAPMAIPVRGGAPIRICEIFCQMVWSADGRFLFASVEERSLSSPGRNVAIPIGADETLPPLPPLGIRPLSDAADIPGAASVPRAGLVAGTDPANFVYALNGVHRNLYRIALP